MSKDKLTRTANRVEAIRTILTNTIWIVIVVVVLAALGRYFTAGDAVKTVETEPVQEKPIVQIPWHEVDQSVATAIAETRKSTEAYAGRQLDGWLEILMERVDTDFLEWYFSYWTQQVLGLEGLWQYGVNYFLVTEPTAAEKMTEKIQAEFSQRVLRPQIAELRLERIVRDTAEHYVLQLRGNLAAIPSTYKIPHADWDRYIEGIAIMTEGTDANRQTPLTLKAITATGAGGALLIAGKTQLLLSKITGKVMAKSAGKASSKMAAKAGSKVAAKAGGKFLGTVVGIGVLVWDVWDHNLTKEENRPILRRALEEYFHEMKAMLINDPEAGIMSIFNDFENQVYQRVRQPQEPVKP